MLFTIWSNNFYSCLNFIFPDRTRKAETCRDRNHVRGIAFPIWRDRGRRVATLVFPLSGRKWWGGPAKKKDVNATRASDRWWGDSCPGWKAFKSSTERKETKNPTRKLRRFGRRRTDGTNREKIWLWSVLKFLLLFITCYIQTYT